MTVTTHHPRTAAVRAQLERLEHWARRGPVRALVTKLVLTVGGFAVMFVGLAMLVLPGPGLVVMAAGLGLLAAEWEWARRVVRAVGGFAKRARQVIVPEGCSPRRKAAAAVLVAAAMVLGAASTAAATAVLGATTVM